MVAGIILALLFLQHQCCFAAKLSPLRSLGTGSHSGLTSLRPLKSAGSLKGSEAAVNLSRRELLQQRANQFNECPTEDYIYSGSTMDSIFDELSVDEFQSAIEYVVRHLMSGECRFNPSRSCVMYLSLLNIVYT